MPIKFNADEIFEIAERIEIDGAKFYRDAEANSSNEKVKKMLLGLAEMEDQHKMIFALMRQDLMAEEKKTTTFDPENRLKDYLHAMADGYVFGTKTQPIAKVNKSNLEEVLVTAMGLEKDSIIFYQGIKEMISSELGKTRIDQIIREEMGHIVTLNGYLTEARG